MKKAVRKKKSAPKTKPKKGTFLDSLPKNDIEHTELMIRMTEKHIDDSSVGKVMAAQAIRLREKLAVLKSKS